MATGINSTVNTMMGANIVTPKHISNVQCSSNGYTFTWDVLDDPPTYVAPEEHYLQLQITPVRMTKWSLFHLLDFRAMHPNVRFMWADACYEEDLNGNVKKADRRLAFRNKEDFALFEEWFGDAIKRFGSVETFHMQYLPSPPDEIKSFKFINSHSIRNNMRDAADWLRDHQITEVYDVGRYLAFGKESDAAMFVLGFSVEGEP